VQSRGDFLTIPVTGPISRVVWDRIKTQPPRHPDAEELWPEAN